MNTTETERERNKARNIHTNTYTNKQTNGLTKEPQLCRQTHIHTYVLAVTHRPKHITQSKCIPSDT